MFREKIDKPKWFLGSIHVQDSDVHGAGCFATRDIKADEVIERAPIILFHKNSFDNFGVHPGGKHILQDYVYMWKDGMMACVLGYGMIYNHSSTPNAFYRKIFDVPCMEYVACGDIRAGEEIFLNYYPGYYAKDLDFDIAGGHFFKGKVE